MVEKRTSRAQLRAVRERVDRALVRGQLGIVFARPPLLPYRVRSREA